MKTLVKPIVKVGNSAGVILPKDWLNGKAKVELFEKPLDIKKEILDMIKNDLSKVIGVYIYGSYSRKENTKDSDIDIVIIANKKIKIKKKNKYFDITVIQKNKIDSFKKTNPLLFYSILNEAKAIINENFLKNLKKEEFKSDLKKVKKYLKKYFEDCDRVLKINKKLLDLDKLENNKYADLNLVYSLILRIRGVYIAKTILKNKKFSNKSFFNILKKDLDNANKYYKIYQKIRDDKKPKKKVKIEDVEKLIKLLDKELKEIKKYAK